MGKRGAGVAPDLAFDALADPVRRSILSVLAEQDECSAGEVARRITSVGRTAVSAHLRVLKAAGLITERRAGRFRFYAVDPSGSARDVLVLLHQVFRSGLAGVEGALLDEGRGRGAVVIPTRAG